MITRKHLQALAVGVGRAAGETGTDAVALAGPIIGALIDAGVVTPNYDGVRFLAAVQDAAPIPYAVVK
jgi:uncharacterized protein (DUF697 family)